MNKEWIKISHNWFIDHKDNYNDYNNMTHANYLDLLGLYETCWFSYDFISLADAKTYGYP